MLRTGQSPTRASAIGSQVLEQINWPLTIAHLHPIYLTATHTATPPCQPYSSSTTTKSKFYGGVTYGEVKNICATDRRRNSRYIYSLARAEASRTLFLAERTNATPVAVVPSDFATSIRSMIQQSECNTQEHRIGQFPTASLGMHRIADLLEVSPAEPTVMRS